MSSMVFDMEEAVNAATFPAQNDRKPSYSHDRGSYLTPVLGVLLLLLIGCASAGNLTGVLIILPLTLLLREAVNPVEAAQRQARFLNWLRHVQNQQLDGIEPPGRYYTGDGIARDQGGHPYEPLTGWEKRRQV